MWTVGWKRDVERGDERGDDRGERPPGGAGAGGGAGGGLDGGIWTMDAAASGKGLLLNDRHGQCHAIFTNKASYFSTTTTMTTSLLDCYNLRKGQSLQCIRTPGGVHAISL